VGPLDIVAAGILGEHADTGQRLANTYLPFVQQLSERELICVYRRGNAFYSSDGVLAQLRSLDAGATWHEEGLVWDPTADDRPYSYSAPFLSRLGDGTLVLVAFRVDCSGPPRPFVNPVTGGFLAVETLLFRSADRGTRWRPPEVIPHPDGLHANLAGPVVELQDGRWFLPFDRGKAYDDPTPVRAAMLGCLSGNQGKTWEDMVCFADGAAQSRAHWHGRVIRLRNGRLFTLLWTQDRRTGRFLGLHRTTSDTGGRHWSIPEPTPLRGETSWAVDLGEGRLFVAYTVREGHPPGIWGAVSADGGQTWDERNAVVLWDATGRETVGVATGNTYPASHNVIAFGRPQATQLSGGDVLVCFWCTRGDVTHNRWCRIRVR
jgi:hypothetical protein